MNPLSMFFKKQLIIEEKIQRLLRSLEDMGHIYKPIQNLKQVLVHTVGPERFSSETGIDEIVSEATGLIAPLWHYVGVVVLACNCYTE